MGIWQKAENGNNIEKHKPKKTKDFMTLNVIIGISNFDQIY
jgi:hypothetical protein